MLRRNGAGLPHPGLLLAPGTPDDVAFGRERRRRKVLALESREAAWSAARTRPRRFVGRDRELAVLRAGLLEAKAGRGQFFLVSGEPGIGKTRLAEEATELAAGLGVEALVGHCYEGERSVPFVPFVEILGAALDRVKTPRGFLRALGADPSEIARILPRLRRIFPDLPPPLEIAPERQQRYLFDSIAEVIRGLARKRPLFLVLEDLHWADEATLALLTHLVPRIREIPVAWLATRRDREEEKALEPLEESVLRSSPANRLALKPLAVSAVEAMLHELSGEEPSPSLVIAIYEETDGNPFFVGEVVAYLAEQGKLFDATGRLRESLEIEETDLPDSVRVLLGRRLDRLAEPARDLLTTAAVIGAAFDPALVAAAAACSTEEVGEALAEAEKHGMAREVSTPTERGWRFSHELCRQTLLARLTRLEAQRLHLRIARALEQVPTGNSEERTAALAHHYMRAAPLAEPRTVARYLALAADRAFEAKAFEDALRSFERALELSRGDDRSCAALYEKIGATQRTLLSYEEAHRSWQEARSLYERLGETETVARIHRLESELFALEARFPESLQMASTGVAALGELPSPLRCQLLASSGAMLGLAGFGREASEMIERATAEAKRLDDASLLQLCAIARAGYDWCFMQFLRAVALRPEIDGALENPKLREFEGAVSPTRGPLYLQIAELYVGNFDEAARIGKRLAPVWTRLGDAPAVGIATRVRAMRDLARSGNLERYAKFAAEDLEAYRSRGDNAFAGSLAHAGLGEFWRGDWEQAADYLSDAADREPPMGAISGTAVYAQVFNAHAGDREQALAWVEGRSATFASGGEPRTLRDWSILLGAVEIYWLCGRRDRAAALYPLVREAMETGAVARWIDWRLLDTLAGLAAASAGDWKAAEGHFREALRKAHALPVRLEQPETRRLYASALLERGRAEDRELAARLLAEAIAAYDKLGMPKHRELAETMLRAGRERRASAPVEAPPRAYAEEPNLFRRDGDFWTIAFAEKTVRLKHVRGLEYLARLLADPGRELHVLDLLSPALAAADAAAKGDGELSARGGGDAGTVLDDRARAQYRRRLADLREELEEATTWNDAGRAARARDEIEFLSRELAAAFGAGGRSRRAASDVERARSGVTLAIKRAIDRITRSHGELGRHLRAATRTGTFCSYGDDPHAAMRWVV